ncbi:hypothetical protein BaRGS_00019048 [Batillaria attramentaria]|uniref:Uncharacterized protein n=1 Tax=Batillaria attramentaria TaxID=370345 RepID=A0ABD0KQW7_9CAEN
MAILSQFSHQAARAEGVSNAVWHARTVVSRERYVEATSSGNKALTVIAPFIAALDLWTCCLPVSQSLYEPCFHAASVELWQERVLSFTKHEHNSRYSSVHLATSNFTPTNYALLCSEPILRAIGSSE